MFQTNFTWTTIVGCGNRQLCNPALRSPRYWGYLVLVRKKCSVSHVLNLRTPSYDHSFNMQSQWYDPKVVMLTRFCCNFDFIPFTVNEVLRQENINFRCSFSKHLCHLYKLCINYESPYRLDFQRHDSNFELTARDQKKVQKIKISVYVWLTWVFGTLFSTTKNYGLLDSKCGSSRLKR